MDLKTKQNSMYMNLRKKKINSRCHLKVFSQGFQNRSYILEYVGLRIAKLSPKLSTYGWDTLYILHKQSCLIKLKVIVAKCVVRLSEHTSLCLVGLRQVCCDHDGDETDGFRLNVKLDKTEEDEVSLF